MLHARFSLKSTLLVICIVIAGPWFLGGCTKSGVLTDSASQPSGVVQTKIPQWVAGTHYEFMPVSLTGISSFIPFFSNQVDLFLNPNEGTDGLTGASPEVHVIQTGNHFSIAQDPLSLTILSLYYHEQQLLKFDDKIGISEVGNSVYRVALFSQVTGGYNDNAFYSPQYDTTFILPYAEDQVPLGLNAGILAHEHFHMIFQKLVLNPVARYNQNSAAARILNNGTAHLPPPMLKPIPLVHRPAPMDPNVQLYEDSYLRGLNEGLADFWGWLYTGDDNFVGRSLIEAQTFRSLANSAVRFPSHKCFLLGLKSLNAQSTGAGPIYGFGNLVARWIKDLHSKMILENAELRDNGKFLSHLGVALRSYSEKLKILPGDQTIGMETFPQILVAELNPQNPDTVAWTKQWTTAPDPGLDCPQ